MRDMEQIARLPNEVLSCIAGSLVCYSHMSGGLLRYETGGLLSTVTRLNFIRASVADRSNLDLAHHSLAATRGVNEALL